MPRQRRPVPPRDPEGLIRLIDDPSTSYLMLYAIQQDARIRDVIAALRLHQGDYFVRGELCYILGSRQARSAVPVLLEALDDESAYVRVQAADALGKVASPAAGPALFQILTRGDPRDPYTWLMTATAACGYRPVFPILLPYLTDSDEQMRAAAAWGLGRLRAIEAEGPLWKALETEDYAMARENMNEALALIREAKPHAGLRLASS
jgi:HEAT repeat protein